MWSKLAIGTLFVGLILLGYHVLGGVLGLGYSDQVKFAPQSPIGFLGPERFEWINSLPNELFQKIVTRHRPPTLQGKSWKFYYATQVTTRPPTFMLFANSTIGRQDSYRRYLENALREELDLRGVPIRLVIRRRT